MLYPCEYSRQAQSNRGKILLVLWQQVPWVNLPAKREIPVQIHLCSFQKASSGLRHNQALQWTPKAPQVYAQCASHILLRKTCSTLGATELGVMATEIKSVCVGSLSS